MTQFTRHALGLLIMVSLTFMQKSSFGQDVPGTLEIIPNNYPKNYFVMHAIVNQPQGKSLTLFQHQRMGYGASYSYNLAKKLIVGVNFKERVFTKKNGESLTIMTFGNHTQGIFRLYHPLYFLLGTEWHYMIPTVNRQLPVIKDPELTTDIGVGVNASLWFFLKPAWLLEAKLQRWRGTKTSQLEAWEASLGLGIGF